LTPYLTTELTLNYQADLRKENLVAEPQNGRGALFTGGLAAILASTCCLGPLVLVSVGVSGAWIGNLTLLEPYRPIFIGVALVALFFAWRRIFRAAHACQPGEVCAIPQVRRTYKRACPNFCVNGVTFNWGEMLTPNSVVNRPQVH
jgi:mercuric ion transport protein